MQYADNYKFAEDRMSRSNPMTGRQPRSQACPRKATWVNSMERYRSAVEGWSLLIKELRKDQAPEVSGLEELD